MFLKILACISGNAVQIYNKNTRNTTLPPPKLHVGIKSEEGWKKSEKIWVSLEKFRKRFGE